MNIDSGPAFVICTYPEKWNGLYAGLLSIAFELRSPRRSVEFVQSICDTLAKLFPGQIVQHFPNDLLMNAIDHDTEDSRRAKALRMFLAQLARLDASNIEDAMAKELAVSAESHADWIEVVIRPYYESVWSSQPTSDYKNIWQTFSENIATYTSVEASASTSESAPPFRSARGMPRSPEPSEEKYVRTTTWVRAATDGSIDPSVIQQRVSRGSLPNIRRPGSKDLLVDVRTIASMYPDFRDVLLEALEEGNPLAKKKTNASRPKPTRTN